MGKTFNYIVGIILLIGAYLIYNYSPKVCSGLAWIIFLPFCLIGASVVGLVKIVLAILLVIVGIKMFLTEKQSTQLSSATKKAYRTGKKVTKKAYSGSKKIYKKLRK